MLPSLLMSLQQLLMEHLIGPHTFLEGRENKHSGSGAYPCQKRSQAYLLVLRLLSQEAGSFQNGRIRNYTQAACRVLNGDSSSSDKDEGQWECNLARSGEKLPPPHISIQALPPPPPRRQPGVAQDPGEEGEGWRLCS